MIVKDLSTDTVMRSIKKVIGHADDKNLKRRMAEKIILFF